MATNSRLVLALDTLDFVQARHESELAAQVAAKERLRDNLTQYLDTVRAAEIEQDDLRDTVIKLTEKDSPFFFAYVLFFSMPTILGAMHS
jgi:hypothetical protein